MEQMALEVFRMSNPDLADDIKRRRASFTEPGEAPTTTTGKYGSIMRRIRFPSIISTTSSRSQTPITSQSNSRSTSPFRCVPVPVVMAVPVMTVYN